MEILANRVKRNDSETDSESAELYGVILEETERLNRTLTAFLDFARSEQDHGGTEPRRANIDGTIDKTVGLLKAQLEQRRVDVRWDPADLDIDIEIAESHLKQVLLNLILNSVEAMDGGGVIRVKTLRHSVKETTFLVEDDGPGVPEKTADTIFDPFVSSKTGGTGLGLSVVARLAYSYGGSVDIDTKYSEGARFLVTLPTVAR